MLRPEDMFMYLLYAHYYCLSSILERDIASRTTRAFNIFLLWTIPIHPILQSLSYCKVTINLKKSPFVERLVVDLNQRSFSINLVENNTVDFTVKY